MVRLYIKKIGLRKELIKLICRIIDKLLVFKQNSVDDFEKRIRMLAENLEGYLFYNKITFLNM
jgi:hypothetical protein